MGKQIFVNQVGLWNEDGTAEFEIRELGDKLSEGVRIIAYGPMDAKEIYLHRLNK